LVALAVPGIAGGVVVAEVLGVAMVSWCNSLLRH